MLCENLYALRHDNQWSRAFRACRKAEAGHRWYASQERGYVEQAIEATLAQRKGSRRRMTAEDRAEMKDSAPRRSPR